MTKNVPTKTLVDAFPDWLSGKGIFSEMEEPPWADEVSADLLDMDYFGNHSGWKKCSPLVYKLFDDEYALSDEDRAKLADLVMSKFMPNWTALWNTYHFEYDPITDYDVSEIGEREGTFQKTRAFEHIGTKGVDSEGSMTHGHAISEMGSTDIDDDTSLTHGETINDTDMANATEEASRYGFNSSEAVPTDKREASSDDAHTTIHSGTDRTLRDGSVEESKSTLHSGTDENSVSTSEEEFAHDGSADAGSDTDEYTKRFSGLKGYTSRQELIARERELWQDSFFDKVYSDVDTVLASMIYMREHKVSPYSIFAFGYLRRHNILLAF